MKAWPGAHRAYATVVAYGLLSGATSLAQDRFEIQVYDAETAPRAALGVETHVNHAFVGAAGGQEGERSHLTFEPHLGVARWAELGAYLQSALLSDGRLAWAGVKVRWKARLPRRLARGLVGFALNLELSAIPRRFEANVWGSELRPICDLRWRRLYLSVNPILAIDLAGDRAGWPQLEPAFKASVDVTHAWALGLEYYAGLGRIGRFLPANEQRHLLYAVVDVLHTLTDKFALGVNFGLGANLAPGGDQVVAKAILAIGR
jgi:hypothetical protein